MNTIRNVLLLCTVATSLSAQSPKAEAQEKASGFLVVQKSSKGPSKSSLKEEIGHACRSSLEACCVSVSALGDMLPSLKQSYHLFSSTTSRSSVRDLARELSGVHEHASVVLKAVSSVQQKCVSTVHLLVEDERPFKKASKRDLVSAHATMSVACNKLQSAAEQLQATMRQIKTDLGSVKEPEVTRLVHVLRGVKQQLAIADDTLRDVRTSLSTSVLLR